MSRVTIHTKQAYCVYLHIHDETVFYVGKGRPYRPFESSHRHRKWIDFVSTIETYEVEIVFWTNDSLEATKEEAPLIREFHPVCNQLMNGYINPERNAKIAHALLNHTLSQESRQKISVARTGLIPNGWQGRQHTPEAREKIRTAQYRVPVICDQTDEMFPSIKATAEALHISKTNLRLHLRGRYSQVGGYTFRAG